jgi:hypothetical protein
MHGVYLFLRGMFKPPLRATRVANRACWWRLQLRILGKLDSSFLNFTGLLCNEVEYQKVPLMLIHMEESY